MTTATVLEAMRPRLAGELLLPEDPGYDEARWVWNAMVDRRPRAIVRCADVGDVVTALRTARELDLDVGVRCGGHSVVGHSVPEGGLMLDLTAMGGVRVDPAVRRAWVQGGALLGALDEEAQRHGLATTAGNVSHTGVGGLTLGGGMGWLARQHGLSCDNVAAYQVVTADGDVMRATEDEHPDLFWGLRGGGGNFGVVTEFEFRLHEVPSRTLTVELDFPLDAAEDALRGWRELLAAAPRSVTMAAALHDRQLTVGLVAVSDIEAGRAMVPQLRALGTAAAERVQTPTYVDLQRRDDDAGAHAFRRYWKGHYFTELTDEAIAMMVGGSDAPSAPGVSLQAYGGAIADVPDDASAFSHRSALVEMVAAARWEDPTEDDARIDGARRYAGRLDHLASGAYVNVLGDEGGAGVRRAYAPGKLSRLTALKDDYDPDNVFRLNQNIPPTPR